MTLIKLKHRVIYDKDYINYKKYNWKYLQFEESKKANRKRKHLV